MSTPSPISAWPGARARRGGAAPRPSPRPARPGRALLLLLAWAAATAAVPAQAAPIFRVEFLYAGNAQHTTGRAVFDIDLGKPPTVQPSGRRDFPVDLARLSFSSDAIPGGSLSAVVDPATAIGSLYGVSYPLRSCRGSFRAGGSFSGVACPERLPLGAGLLVGIMTSVDEPNSFSFPAGRLGSQFVRSSDLFLQGFQTSILGGAAPAPAPEPPTAALLAGVLGLAGLLRRRRRDPGGRRLGRGPSGA